MQSFFYLFTRYLAEKAQNKEMYVHSFTFTCLRSLCTHSSFYDSDWDRIKSPSEDKIVPYAKLRSGSPQNLNKLAVLKVNGGLGTSMGASSAFRATFPI